MFLIISMNELNFLLPMFWENKVNCSEYYSQYYWLITLTVYHHDETGCSGTFSVVFGGHLSAKSVPWCPWCSLEGREAHNALALLYAHLQKWAFLRKNCIPTNQCLTLGAGWYSHIVTVVICCSWKWRLQISQLSNVTMYDRALVTCLNQWMVNYSM